jgi:hypothetical protein
VPAAFAGTQIEALVTGNTAENQDYFDVMKHWLPIVLVFVLGLSFVLLTVAFRSIVVAGTAIVLNLLSFGAAFGLVVAVFQHGWGSGLLGFTQVETIEAWVPLFLFAVLFGLSMDYQVFLLSRIRERFTSCGNTTEAVAFGIGSTARIITGAALIIVAVVPRLRHGRPRDVPADGLRHRDRAPARRDARPRGARARGDDTARGRELVPAELALVDPARRGRGQRGRAGDRRPARSLG